MSDSKNPRYGADRSTRLPKSAPSIELIAESIGK
jgi:hypothetical protein